MRFKQCYSQFGEDIIAQRLLSKIRNGFYVDIGAHHPFRLSNTALLHENGWQGINVEPGRAGFEEFEVHRPNAINLQIAIHNEETEVVLHQFEGDRANTIIENRARNQSKNKKATGQITVPSMSVNALLDRYLPSGTGIDYFNMDIEGYDYAALSNLDFDKYAPRVCCVEIHGFDPLKLGNNATVRFMVEKDYKLVAVNFFSFTFVRNDFQY